MKTGSQNQTLVGAVLLVAAGALLLLAPRAIPLPGPSAALGPVATQASDANLARPDRATAAPLPTIALLTAQPVVAGAPGAPGEAGAAGDGSALLPAGGADATAPMSDGELSELLASQLACLRPGMRREAALDSAATSRLADAAETDAPEGGALQLPAGGALLVVTTEEVAREAAGARCGETLLFGAPPLDWVAGERFGIAVVGRAGGLVISIITEA